MPPRCQHPPASPPGVSLSTAAPLRQTRPSNGKLSAPDNAVPHGLELPNSPLSLSIGMFWLCGVIGAFAPLLPVYLNSLGIGASGFALLNGVQALTALAIGQAMGYVADVMLLRHRLMLYLAAGSALVAAIFPLIPARLDLLAIGMVGMAFFLSQRLVIYNALVFDSARGEALYGKIRMMGSIGFVLIAPTIGFMADQPSFGPAIMWPVLVGIELLFALSLLALRDAPPAVRLAEQGGRIGFIAAQKILFASPVIRWFLVFTLVVQVFHLPNHILQLVLLKELGASSLTATLAVTLAAIAEILIFYYARQIMGHFRLMTMFLVVPFALAARWGIIALFPNIAAILASNVLHMITYGLAYLTGVLFINRELPKELKSSGQAIFGMTFAVLSLALGNLAASGFIHVIESRWALNDLEALRAWFAFAAAFQILGILAWIPLNRAFRREQEGG